MAYLVSIAVLVFFIYFRLGFWVRKRLYKNKEKEINQLKLYNRIIEYGIKTDTVLSAQKQNKPDTKSGDKLIK